LGNPSVALLLKSGTVNDEAVLSAVITMYAGLRELAASRRVHMIESNDLVSWNTMISAYSQNGEPEDAFEIFLLMHRKGMKPNLVTMLSVLQSCGSYLAFIVVKWCMLSRSDSRFSI